MTKRRVFLKPDGSVAVMTPAPKAIHLREKSTGRLITSPMEKKDCYDSAGSLFDKFEAAETETEFHERICAVDAKKQGLDALSFDDIDIELPPRLNAKGIEIREKWRGEKGAGVWIDEAVKTRGELRGLVESALVAELNKSAPNITEVVRLRLKIEKEDY